MKVKTAMEVADRYNISAFSSTILFESKEFALRVCSVGTDAFFEWITVDGDPVGDMFYEISDDCLE